MAHIEQRSRNTWRLIVDNGVGPDGKRKRERRKITIDDEALLKTTKKLKAYLDQELIKFKMEVESGHYISPDKMTFASFAEKWKDKHVMKNLEYKTIENYLLQLNKRLLPRFGPLQLDKIKTMHLVDSLDELEESGTGSATRVYVYRVLRSIFTKAVEWKVMSKEANPIDGITKPKEKPNKELRVYDELESAQLFKALQNEEVQFRILVSLALTTGMRRGELLGLEWSHIDLTAGIIRITQTIPAFREGVPVIKGPKNSSSFRQVAVSPSLLVELKAFRREWIKQKAEILNQWKLPDREFLFCNFIQKQHYGMPLYPKTLTDRWREFSSRNELKYIRFHDLRHTSATLLINQGVHAKIISERLGHSNIGTTMNVYGHVIQKADVAAASLFDQILAK